MFGFIKKLKPVYEIAEPLTVRERALRVFSNIEGIDHVKEPLESPDRAHTLLMGPPSCAKSLFMLEIEKFMRTKVYFAEGASTTKRRRKKAGSEEAIQILCLRREHDRISRNCISCCPRKIVGTK